MPSDNYVEEIPRQSLVIFFRNQSDKVGTL